MRLLFTMRGIRHWKEMTVRDFVSTPPFLVLDDESPNAVVFGVAGRRGARSPADPTEFATFTKEGDMRATGIIRAEATENGSILSTETWVELFGARARLRFRLYWFVIGPFSGLIRREILKAAKRRAEAGGQK